MAEFLMSRYASGQFVPNVAAALDNPAWNPRAIFQDAQQPFPLPERVFGGSRTELPLGLAEPDVRYFEVQAGPGARVALGSLAASVTNVRIAVLRAR